MKDKKERLKTIKKLIEKNRINSQDKLLELLNSQEFNVTQATLSRDLKFLKVSKVPDAKEGYYYSLVEDKLQKVSYEKYIADINRGFLSINFSGNISVIKTFSGHANSVALAFDMLELDNILGTIAGDDTVIVVLKEKLTPANFLNNLRKKFPAIEV